MIWFGLRKSIDGISIDIALQSYNIFVPFTCFNFFLAFLKYGANFLLIYHITHKLLNELERKKFHDQTYDIIRMESIH